MAKRNNRKRYVLKDLPPHKVMKAAHGVDFLTQIKHSYVEKSTTQAQRIISKFGGVERLAEALGAVGKGRSRMSIYRWMYPKEKGGTGGLVPTSAMADIMNAARLEGVHLTYDDLDPRELIKKVREYEE